MAPSFSTWLESRDQRLQVPKATRLTQIIAAAGSAGVAVRTLRKAVKLDGDIVDGLLAGMLATGQVEIVSGQGSETILRTAVLR